MHSVFTYIVHLLDKISNVVDDFWYIRDIFLSLCSPPNTINLTKHQSAYL